MIGTRISKLAPLAALAFLAASCSRSPDQRAAQPLSPRSKSAAAQNAARCTGFNPERNLYFGDMHVHTSYSFDAYGFGTRTDPFGAYAFAQGAPAQIASPPPDPSRTVQLVRRLDFAAVTDHSEGFGEYPPGMFQREHPARDAWEHEQMAAEAANDTSAHCSFSALIASEWTGSMSGRWWPRNALFRNAPAPGSPVSSRAEKRPQRARASLRAV